MGRRPAGPWGWSGGQKTARGWRRAGTRRAAAGYSLLETLVALTLVTAAGLALMSVAWQMPLAVERSEAKVLSFRALEGTLEVLRSGALPLAPGPIPTAPGTSGLRLRSGVPLSISVQLELSATTIPGLLDVTLSATYFLRGRSTTTAVRSKIWSLGTGAMP